MSRDLATHIRDHALAIAAQAQAIADGKVIHRQAAALRLLDNAATLLAWIRQQEQETPLHP